MIRPASTVPGAPLPPAVLSAIAAIVRDMRDVPRDCITDRAELMHWLRRMAARVEGVGRMQAVLAPPRPKRAPAPLPARPATPRDLAEAVFGKGSASARTPGPRTITSRRGRAVRVEVRRAREVGQPEMKV